jgi:hypothetical protein
LIREAKHAAQSPARRVTCCESRGIRPVGECVNRAWFGRFKGSEPGGRCVGRGDNLNLDRGYEACECGVDLTCLYHTSGYGSKHIQSALADGVSDAFAGQHMTAGLDTSDGGFAVMLKKRNADARGSGQILNTVDSGEWPWRGEIEPTVKSFS